jgi:hypothetical protein
MLVRADDGAIHRVDSPARDHGAPNKAGAGPLQQSGRVQSGAEPWVPCSVAEMRRFLWLHVLATTPTIGPRLAWSAWRRWYQGVAQLYHYQRRTVP